MSGESRKPVIVLAFANERSGSPDRNYLETLKREERELKRILGGLRFCDVTIESGATPSDVVRAFDSEKYRGRVAILHYGGHANRNALLFESEEGGNVPVDAQDMAKFLGDQQGLVLVFLNGCATQGHVKALHESGVKAVIGTWRKVADEMATTLAVEFYWRLAEGMGLEEALRKAKLAAAVVATGRNPGPRLEEPDDDEDPEFGRYMNPAPMPFASSDDWELHINPHADAEFIRSWTLAKARLEIGWPELEKYRNAYLDRMIAKHGKISLPVFGLNRDEITVNLEKMFIGLRGDIETYSQRSLSQDFPEDLLTGSEFDLSNYLATHRHIRESRSAAGFTNTGHHLLSIAKLIEAVSSKDFRLVILGDPGSGKTTISKWLAVKMAAALKTGATHLEIARGEIIPEDTQTDAQPIAIASTYLPVLIAVSTYAEFLSGLREMDEHANLLAYVSNQILEGVPSEKKSLFTKYIEATIQQGKLLVILDGLDELPDSVLAHHDLNTPRWKQRMRKTVLEQIRNLADEFRPTVDPEGRLVASNALLVTSRIKGYETSSLQADLMHLTIEPMSPAERRAFFAKWCSEVLAVNPKSNSESDVGFFTELTGLIDGNARLTREVNTPLFCGLIASVAWNSWQSHPKQHEQLSSDFQRALPKNRTEIYEHMVEILLNRWQERYMATGSTDTRLAMLVTDKHRLLAVLQSLALAIHEDPDLGTGAIDEKRLVKTVVAIAIRLDVFRKSMDITESAFAEFIIRLLTRDSGFLIERAPRVYAFQHRSIQEYLAGRLLAEVYAETSKGGDAILSLQELIQHPQRIVHWREVALHGIASLQSANASRFLQLIESCLRMEIEEHRPFPSTLLFLLEARSILSNPNQPELVRLLIRYIVLTFSRDAELRLTLWPAFRSAFLGLPMSLVTDVFTEEIEADHDGIVTASIAEIIVQLGTVRSLTGWISPNLLGLLIEARDLDSEPMAWPIHRCISLCLTAWQGTGYLEQVTQLQKDKGRTALSRPDYELKLSMDQDFALRMLILTGCIDYRESCYLKEYFSFDRFLQLGDGLRRQWRSFLADYYGGADEILSIAEHLDFDFQRALDGANRIPELGCQYALSLNPRSVKLISGYFQPRYLVGDRRPLLVRLLDFLFFDRRTENVLLRIADQGQESSVDRLRRSHRKRLIPVLKQRMMLLDDGIRRGVPVLLSVLARVNSNQEKSYLELFLWRAALKSLIRAFGSVNVWSFDIKELSQSFPYFWLDGIVLAEWWVMSNTGLSVKDFVYAGATFLDNSGSWQRPRSWAHAVLEVSTAGSITHPYSLEFLPIESFYPSFSWCYGEDEIPFHALSIFCRTTWESSVLTRRLVEDILPQVENEFPAISAEGKAIRWIIAGPAKGSSVCFPDAEMIGFEYQIADTARTISVPYYRARFLVRMFPYTHLEDRKELIKELWGTITEISDIHRRLLVLEQFHRIVVGPPDDNGIEPAQAKIEEAWEFCLFALKDPVHRSLAFARATLTWPQRNRAKLIMEAVESIPKIGDVAVRSEIIRELLPIVGLFPSAFKHLKNAIKSIRSSIWRSWAGADDSEALFWLAEQVTPGTPEVAAFAALRARVLLGEALVALDANDGPNSIHLWHRCLRGDEPIATLVSRGRLEAFDLTPAVALALDELLSRGELVVVQHLMPLCVNPSPQLLSIVGRWARNEDSTISKYGKLLRAEILGCPPEFDLMDWANLMEDRDDRTRYRSQHCIRHPLVVPEERRHRFSKLGISYLFAWDQALQHALEKHSSSAIHLFNFSGDLVADSRNGFQALIDLARLEGKDSQSARRILCSFEVLDEPSWECLLLNFAQEKNSLLQECFLRITVQIAQRGTLTEERFCSFRETLQSPSLANFCEKPFFCPRAEDYLRQFRMLWEANGGSPPKRVEFIEKLETSHQISVNELIGQSFETFKELSQQIALSHLYLHFDFVTKLSSHVDTRWALSALEFFLEWYSELAFESKRNISLHGRHQDHLLLVAAAINTKISTLLRGNVRTPADLADRLHNVIFHSPRWGEKSAAMDLLGNLMSADKILLDCLVYSCLDQEVVRASALQVVTCAFGMDRQFIEGVIPYLQDDSGIVAYMMGRVLRYAYMQEGLTEDDKSLIIRALEEAKISERSRRLVYFEHHARNILPELPRLDRHFSRLLAEIWLGEQAGTLRQSKSGWTSKSNKEGAAT